MAGLEQQIEQLKQANEQTSAILDNNNKAAQPVQQVEEQAATPAPVTTDIYHYGLGRYLTTDDDEKFRQKVAAANRAGERVWNAKRAYGNPSDKDYLAALRGDEYAWNAVYGDPDKKNRNNAASVFNGFVANLTPSQRASIENYIRTRQDLEAKQNQEKTNKALAAHEKQYEFGYGENGNVHVTKDISDKIKEIGNFYADVKEKDAELRAVYEKTHGVEMQAKYAGASRNITSAPEPEDVNKARRQQLVAAMREQLKAAGINIGDAPAEGEYDDIEKLLDSAPDWETENAMRKAIGLATSRTEYQPEEKSIEDRLRERQALKEEAELRAKNMELERARNRQSFAGIAASIGDMIRASEGAKVSPRDWQQIYDNLTAQEKANIDNYKLRMDRMNADARAERLAAAQAAALREEKERERQFKHDEAEASRGWKSGESEKDRVLRWLLGGDRLNSYYYGRRGGSSSNPYTYVMLGDTSWMIPKGETVKNYVYGVLNILTDKKSYKPGVDVDSAMPSILDEQNLMRDPYGYYQRNIASLLRSRWKDLTPEAQQLIENTAKGHGGVRGQSFTLEGNQVQSRNNSASATSSKTSSAGAYGK